MMKKILLLLGCLVSLVALVISIVNISIDEEPNQSEAQEIQTIEEEIPHIFHGMTRSISVGEFGEDGDIIGLSEQKLYAVKYALYLDNGLIVIFDDNTQHHRIIMYIGSEECEDNTRYLFATYDQNEKQGYVEFDYYKDGTTLMMLDYSDYVIGYILETFMPQEEFEERLNKYKK